MTITFEKTDDGNFLIHLSRNKFLVSDETQLALFANALRSCLHDPITVYERFKMPLNCVCRHKD